MNQTTGELDFRALHHTGDLLIMPNPWDKGSTRIFSQCGFKALATTSGGMAYSLGKRDGHVTREEALRHCRDIVSATDLPVSADLEKGFGDTPESVAMMIRDAAETGVAGCSIEDYSGDPDNAIFDEELAVERIAAAVDAKNSLDRDFVLTARCEAYLWNQRERDPVIRRLQRFVDAGADVVFSPGMNDISDIEILVQSVNVPVNVVVSSPNRGYAISDLERIGVKRISIGSSMAQYIYGSVIKTVSEFAKTKSLDFVNEAMDYEELETWF
ncbi:MAG: isocitrate lyase/phosphoenolpyruvate mutase family protein [Granulosicoccus sp.]|nr:isocitrate lyase/phosphoenolpyruvate mutase family protein [Granulosicoccus sp.]